jgi:hypothetical protein
MFKILKSSCVLGILVVTAYSATPIPPATPQSEPTSKDPISIVITFRDGRQETYAMADIASVEYKDLTQPTIGTDYFLGKWEVGDGNSGSFFITLEPNGEAVRSLGASHGIWAIVGEEARISWDDGWHDVIRKAGDGHEKFAFAPSTALDDKAANVTAARKTEPKKATPKP